MAAPRFNSITELHSAMNGKTTRTAAWIADANKFLAARGWSLQILETYRTAERQNELWRQGRNKNGAVTDPKKIVTYTTDSLHEYRLAFDWCPARRDPKTGKILEIPWQNPDLWDAVYAAVPPSKYGLEVLSWERPHLQIAGGYATAKKLKITANQPRR
jgi:hypothetical protein